MEYPTRKVIRLQNYDYSRVNYYFLTLCSYEKACIFGSIEQDSRIGAIARKGLMEIPDHYQGVRVDHFVVMPNHIHMILVLEEDNIQYPNISQIISWYKAGVSREVRKVIPDMKVWQRSFYDHVIRDQQDYENIWNYIENNPLKWKDDRFYFQEQFSDTAGGMNAAPTRKFKRSHSNGT